MAYLWTAMQDDSRVSYTYRMRVPGGWLVKSKDQVEMSDGSTKTLGVVIVFVPDRRQPLTSQDSIDNFPLEEDPEWVD